MARRVVTTAALVLALLAALTSRIDTEPAVAAFAPATSSTPSAPDPSSPHPPAVRMWLSRPGLLGLEAMPVTEEAGRPADAVVDVDPSVGYQNIDGFGASITSSSAHLLASSPERAALMVRLFDTQAGIGVSLLRQPFGATDYSVSGPFTYDDLEPGATDPDLARFSIRPDLSETIPLLQEARRLNPDLHVIGSAWSPPAWMKSNQALSDGTLLPSASHAYAAYLAAAVLAYEAQGIPLLAVTPGTEPVSYMKGSAPHLSMTREQQRGFVRDELGPALARLPNPPLLLAFDDNFAFGHPAFAGYPEAILADPGAAPFVDGTAGHCYFGDLSYMSRLHDRFPDKAAYITECSSGVAGPYNGRTVEMLIDATRNWASGVVLWNVALDEKEGPYRDGCDGRCTPLLTIHPDGSATPRWDYYALGHFSRFVRPGARRVASSLPNRVPNVAFANADGTIVVVAENSGADPKRVEVRAGAVSFQVDLPPHAVATLVW